MEQNEPSKLTVHSETVYLLAIVLLAFAVAMVSAADLGVSMIVAPAYVLCHKLTFLTFGQCEYVLQSIVFVVFCLLMKRVKAVYFSSFITCIIYGAVLDLWRLVIPAFNPDMTAPGSMGMPVRIVCFVLGMLLTTFSVAMFFSTYLYPQVYDFFVKGVCEHFGIDRTKMKISFDVGCLVVSTLMSLVFFRKLVGVGVGTLIMTCCNGLLIKLFSGLFDRFLDIRPFFPRFAARFDLKN